MAAPGQHSIKVQPDFKTLYHRMKDINDLSLKTISELQADIRRLRLLVQTAEAEARKPYADKIMELEEAFVEQREALVKRDDRIEELRDAMQTTIKLIHDCATGAALQTLRTALIRFES